MRPFPFLATGLGLLVAGPALADAEITVETTDLPDGKTHATTMALANDRVRIETGSRVMLFLGDQGKAYMVDPASKTYFDLSRMGERMAGMNAAMQQRLAGMPEAQRKQIEAMMAQRGVTPGATQGAESAAQGYEKAESRTVSGLACTVYHETRGGQLIADLCIAPIGTVGLSETDLAGLKAMGETMKHAFGGDRLGPVARFDFDAQTRAIGFSGIPIETTVYSNGQPLMRTVFKAIDHQPVGADRFTIPAGYSERQTPGGPPGSDDQ